jgi:hypothetical protein
MIHKMGGAVMNGKKTSTKIALLERELSVLVEELDKRKLDLRSEMDVLRIEVETLNTLLKKHHPKFAGTFGKIKSQTMMETNPEWPSRQL